MYTLKTSDNTSITVNQSDVISPEDSDSVLPITLYGKNFKEYGQDFQNNLYYILENFCGASAPLNPMVGMLWYDNKNDMLKIYTGKDKPDGPWMQVAYEDVTTTTTTEAPTTTTTTAVTTTNIPTTTTTTSAALSLSLYTNVKFGITWGGNVDLDTVAAAYDANGVCTQMFTVSSQDFIVGTTYGGDIQVGGNEEYYDIDLTKLTCSKLVLGILEFTANSFINMSSLNTRIVDNPTATNIAQFSLTTITKSVTNTPSTTCIVGVFTKVGTGWTFESHQKLINSHSGKFAIVRGDLYSSLGL